MLDNLVPSTVDATVEDGGVTLAGSTKRQFERDEAEFQVGNVLAVLDLLEEIDLNSPTAEAGDLKIVFKGAFGHNSKLNADDLSVPTSSGTATFEGSSAGGRSTPRPWPWPPPARLRASRRSTAASWSSADRQDSAARGEAARAAAYPREEQRDGIRAIP